MVKQDTRQILIEKGSALIAEQGFLNTGIMDILKAVGIPKGSFYHYFPSKEDFGMAVIENYCRLLFLDLEQHFFHDTSRSPLQRLRHRIMIAVEEFKSSGYRSSCLFGQLGAEMSSQSEIFRRRLEAGFTQWVDLTEALLIEAQVAGEVSSSFNARNLAEFFISSYEGTLLRCKVVRDDAPVRVFEQFFFHELCKIKAT